MARRGTIAAADVNRDGAADLVVAAGPGGGPRVALFDGRSLATGPRRLRNDFFAFDADLRTGLWVAARDLGGSAGVEVATGAGSGAGPRVRTFDDDARLAGGDRAPAADVLATDPATRVGARPEFLPPGAGGQGSLRVWFGNNPLPILGEAVG